MSPSARDSSAAPLVHEMAGAGFEHAAHWGRLMHDEPPTHRARQAAGAELEQAARRFVVTSEQVETGDATEQQLRARRFDLERAALRYAAAFGWGPAVSA